MRESRGEGRRRYSEGKQSKVRGREGRQSQGSGLREEVKGHRVQK